MKEGKVTDGGCIDVLLRSDVYRARVCVLASVCARVYAPASAHECVCVRVLAALDIMLVSRILLSCVELQLKRNEVLDLLGCYAA